MSQPESSTQENQKTAQTTPPGEEAAWKVYVAAALGAMAIAVTDSVSSSSHTVHGLVQALPSPLATWGYMGLLMTFIVLPMAGFAISWVQRPRTTTDAFARGFALFAILGFPADHAAELQSTDANVTVSPIGKVENRPALRDLAGLFWIREARAETENMQEGNEPTVEASIGGMVDSPRQSIRLVLEAGQKTGEATHKLHAKIIVRDAESGKTLVRAAGDQVQIVAPSGKYLILVEARGYHRTEAELEIRASPKQGDEPTTYGLHLKPSGVPLPLQRLLPPEKVQLKELGSGPVSDRVEKSKY